MIFLKYSYEDKIIKTCSIDYKDDITWKMAHKLINDITVEMLRISKETQEFADKLKIEYSFNGVNFALYDKQIIL